MRKTAKQLTVAVDGERFTLLRQELGYKNQGEMARKVRVSQASISRLESGLPVVYPTLLGIAAATGLSLEQLGVAPGDVAAIEEREAKRANVRAELAGLNDKKATKVQRRPLGTVKSAYAKYTGVAPQGGHNTRKSVARAVGLSTASA